MPLRQESQWWHSKQLSTLTVCVIEYGVEAEGLLQLLFEHVSSFKLRISLSR